MTKKLFCSLCLSSVLVSTSAVATTVSLPGGMTPVQVGAAAGQSNLAFFTFADSAAAATVYSCPNGYYYIDLSTAPGRLVYNTLLTAQITGLKIARIDFNGGSGVQCSAVLIMLNNS